MATINIVVGSTSIHKINAVERACKELGINAVVKGFKTSTRQNEQPVGLDEIFAGAFQRVAQASESHPNKFIIGIESGIVRADCIGTLDIAGVVLVTDDHRLIKTTTSGIHFPDKYVDLAEKRGFDKNTVGSVIAEILKGDKTDPHAMLTDGKVTRLETLVVAVKIALMQI